MSKPSVYETKFKLIASTLLNNPTADVEPDFFFEYLSQWYAQAQDESKKFNKHVESFLDTLSLVFPKGDPRWKTEQKERRPYPSTEQDPVRQGRIDLLDYALYSGDLPFIKKVIELGFSDLSSEDLKQRLHTVYMYKNTAPQGVCPVMPLSHLYTSIGNKELLEWAASNGADFLQENAWGRNALASCFKNSTVNWFLKHTSFDLDQMDKKGIPAHHWFESSTLKDGLTIHLNLLKRTHQPLQLNELLTCLSHAINAGNIPSKKTLEELDQIFDNTIDVELDEIRENPFFEVLAKPLLQENNPIQKELGRFCVYAVQCFEEQSSRGLPLTPAQHLVSQLIYIKTRKTFTRLGSRLNDLLQHTSHPFCYQQWGIQNYEHWMQDFSKEGISNIIGLMVTSFASMMTLEKEKAFADGYHWRWAMDVHTYALLPTSVQSIPAIHNALAQFELSGNIGSPPQVRPLSSSYNYEQVFHAIRRSLDSYKEKSSLPEFYVALEEVSRPSWTSLLLSSSPELMQQFKPKLDLDWKWQENHDWGTHYVAFAQLSETFFKSLLNPPYLTEIALQIMEKPAANYPNLGAFLKNDPESSVLSRACDALAASNKMIAQKYSQKYANAVLEYELDNGLLPAHSLPPKISQSRF